MLARVCCSVECRQLGLTLVCFAGCCFSSIPIAIQPIAQDFPALPHAFFFRPAEVVASALIGCKLVKRQSDGTLLWGVIVETEA